MILETSYSSPYFQPLLIQRSFNSTIFNSTPGFANHLSPVVSGYTKSGFNFKVQVFSELFLKSHCIFISQTYFHTVQC